MANKSNLTVRIENRQGENDRILYQYKHAALVYSQQGRQQDAANQMNNATYAEGFRNALELVRKWMKEEGMK